MNDEDYMKLALKEAKIALKEGNWPIGCVLELNENVIAQAHNQVYTLKDRIAHAEILALDKARKEIYENPQQITLYTTYEPCPMCFGASILSRIKRIVYGVDMDDSGAIHLKENLPSCFKQKEFYIEITSGILEEECAKVFMKSKLAKELNKEGLLKNL
jgi:tRNA(adenine34) deaminase